MRKGGVVLIRVHPARADNIKELVRFVIDGRISLVGHAVLISGVAAAAPLGAVWRVAQMLLHLQFKESFQGLFHQTLRDGF